MLKLKSKIKAYLQLIRIELAFAAGLCVVFGGIMASGNSLHFAKLGLGFFCAFFIAGSANILNDYFDFEVDKKNAPNRPLPSGIVTKPEVLLFSSVVALLGLSISLTISIQAFLFCVFLWVLSFLYNRKLKETGLPGNISVAICVASTFILGGLLAGDPWNKYVLLISLIAFFVDLGEEIAGDAMDAEGDRLRQTKSIAIKYGRDVALKIAAVSFVVVVLISLVPVFFTSISYVYILLLLLADFLILVFALKLAKSQTRANGLFYMRAIYSIAYLGLAVIYTLAFTGKA